MLKARVAHFYGFSDAEIDKFPYSKFLDYAKCITMISASDRMADLSVHTYPHLNKQNDRKKIIKGLRKEIERFMPKKPATMEGILQTFGLKNGK